MEFFSNLKKIVFPTIIALTALSVSASAAFYSVTGLSKLFAGASLQVIIMASALELAKLVIASLLYQYWNELNRLLRVYLTTAAVVLILITSVGIYGFLSGAYQETANKSEIIDKEVNILTIKKERFQQDRDYYVTEKKQLDESITELRRALTNNQQQYKDKETGQILTTTSSANRKALQSQISDAVNQRDEVSDKIQMVTDSINSIDIKIMETETGTELAKELGPLRYVSELTNIPMNKVVNILLLIIIFVFDPLAIALVIAANFAFSRITKKRRIVDIDESTIQNYIDELSKEAGRIERENQETKFTPTEEEINKIEEQLMTKHKNDETSIIEPPKTIVEQPQPKTEPPTPQTTTPTEPPQIIPQNKQIVSHKRNARNTRIDRI